MIDRNKYLIITPSWLGDMTMSQSLYMSLKKSDPSCVIDIVAPKHCAKLSEFMPEINKIFIADFKHGQFGLKSRFRFAQQFKNKGYTHAIVLPNSWKSALVPYFAKIPVRIGWVGEFRYLLLNDIRKLKKINYPLMVSRYFALGHPKNKNLEKSIDPKLAIKENSIKTIKQKFNIHTNKKILTLCPGAEFGPAKQWPANHFAELAKNFLKLDWQVFIVGSNKEIDIASKIKELCKGYDNNENLIDFSSKTTIDEAVIILSLSTHNVSNDSGLMHISCALNIPVTAIYGSTTNKFSPPLSDKAEAVFIDGLACRPCFKRECHLGHLDCLNKLYPLTVIKSIYKFHNIDKE